MALPKSLSRQTYLSLSVSTSTSDVYSSQRSPTRVTNIRLKNRLDEAWIRAEKKFNEETKRCLGSYDVKSKDGILRQLRQRYESEGVQNKKNFPIRTDTLEKILNAIELVGAFAAQGVSIIFGPANLCFNAIAYLIDAPRQLIKVREELQALLEELEGFLVKFKIYRRIEDVIGLCDELWEDTNLLLISFVDVCGVATKILQGSKWDHVKNNMSVVLLKDDKVAKAIEEFRIRCNSSNSLANTVILEHVLSSEVDVKQILSAARRLESGMGLLIARSNDEKTRIVNKDHLERIRRTLFFRPPSEEFLVPSNHENLAETLAVLQSTAEYDHWMNISKVNRCMLILWGPPGSGKSYMLDAVRDHLNTRRECAGRVESSTYVAIHDFDEMIPRFAKDQKKSVSPLADILRKIAFQVAVQSTNYAKELATLLSTTPSLRSEKDITKVWRSLRLSEVRALSGATMYILLDSVKRRGLNGDLRKLLDLLMDSRTNQLRLRKGLKIRILLTMDSDPDIIRANQHLSVQVNAINGRLVSNFATEEMRRRDIFQDIDKETMALRQDISKQLTEAAEDLTFRDVQQKLTALKEAIDDDRPYSEMSRILDNKSHEQWSDSGIQIIEDLQKHLNQRSITLLNKILQFLMYAPDGCMSLDDLEAGLRLSGAELPIEPLIKKIHHQFKNVIHILHDMVHVQGTVLSALRKMAAGRPSATVKQSGEPLVSMNIVINNASERTVKRFVWDLNEQLSTGKFDFSTASPTACTKKVFVDGLQAQLTITQLCFSVIGGGWDDKTKPMLAYACLYLPNHLASLYEMASELTDTDRRMIGEGLITFLTDPYYIKSKHENYGLGYWMYEDRAVDGLRYWLEDESTRQQLPLREQRWIQKVTDRSHGRLGFLQDLAIALGEYWLTDVRANCYALYLWLNTFIEKNTAMSDVPAENERNNVMQSETEKTVFSPDLFYLAGGLIDPAVHQELDNGTQDDSPREEISVVDKIKRAAAWVLSKTKVAPCNSFFLALGNTCLAAEEWAVGIECFARIYPEYPDKHFALLGSAFCKLGLRDTIAGLAQGREGFAIFRNYADEGQLSADDLDFYITNLKRMGEHFESLRHLPEALSFYEEAFIYKREDLACCWRVLKLRCQTDESQSAAYAVLFNWSDGFEKVGGKSPAVSILEMISGGEFETVLLPLSRAMKHRHLQNMFVQIIEDAIQLVGSSRDILVLGRLRYLQGVVYSLSPESGSSTRAAFTWREVLNSISADATEIWGVSHLLEAASDNLLQYEFDLARSRILEDTSLSLEKKHDLYLEIKDTFSHTINTCPALANYHGVDTCENFVVSLCNMVDANEARRFYKKDMAQALEILTDGDAENDAAGIYILSRIFCVMGDVVGTLSAFSLYDRAITRRRFNAHRESPEPEWTMRDKIATGSIRSCTSCSKALYSSDVDGMWWCQFCPSFDLCRRCKEKREKGTLRIEKCSEQHISSYIHLTHSGYSEAELRGSRVKIDWELVKDGRGNFTRKGGRILELCDWVEELRMLWELPRPDGEGSRAQQ